MPDTQENQKLYPQPSGQKEGCGFPVVRITAIFCLVSGVMLAYRTGSLHVHERILWHDMWDCYQKNDVVLADCGFCSFADYHLLKENEVDCVMRLHQKRKENKIIKRFSKNDYLVQWEKGKRNSCPSWMTPKQWDQIPQTMIVRHLKVVVHIPGFRTKNLTLATTLLDPRIYPALAIGDLYRQRWMCELFLRDIKITMCMKVLRSKTPVMLLKEITVFSIAYNLIRSLIWETALNKGLAPYWISFKGAISTILQWAPFLTMITDSNEKKRFINALKMVIAADLIPIRNKTRWEPRAIKRRQNCKYQLLTKPRHQFMEIPHRHKYRKNLALS